MGRAGNPAKLFHPISRFGHHGRRHRKGDSDIEDEAYALSESKLGECPVAGV